MYVSETKNLLNDFYLFSKIIDKINKNQMKKYYILKLILIILLKKIINVSIYNILKNMWKIYTYKFIKLALHLCSFSINISIHSSIHNFENNSIIIEENKL